MKATISYSFFDKDCKYSKKVREIELIYFWNSKIRKDKKSTTRRFFRKKLFLKIAKTPKNRFSGEVTTTTENIKIKTKQQPKCI